MNPHVKVHINDIIKSSKRSGKFTGSLTIIRVGGKEYCWQRLLSTKERMTLCEFFSQQDILRMPDEKNICADGNIVHIWYQGGWFSEAF